MKLITERDRIQDVAKSWKANYYQKYNGEWMHTRSGHSVIIYEKLLDLDLNTCTANDVENIIGNDSWTTIKCDECEGSTKKAVELGQEPDYESSTAIICMDCLKKANTL